MIFFCITGGVVVFSKGPVKALTALASERHDTAGCNICFYRLFLNSSTCFGNASF